MEILISLIVVVFALAASYKSTMFNRRFPPIDDDEFVRHCGPGVNRDVALRVRQIVAEQLGIAYEQVYPEQRFVQDLDC